MKTPTCFLIKSKMFELGSSASPDFDMLPVSWVFAKVSCPMPSGNSDALQVMLVSSSSKAKCLNLPDFYFTFKKSYREKEEKKNNLHEREPVSLYLNRNTKSKCPQQRGNFLPRKMQNAESRWQVRQTLKPHINGCLKKPNADGWVDRC